MGDVLLGLASSGVHSNGYSLVRRLAADKGWKLDRPALFDQDRLLIDALMEPTRHLCEEPAAAIRARAHPCAGPYHRRRPARKRAARPARELLPDRSTNAWEQPRLMAFLQAQGHIEPAEMARTFNCGIGMVLAVRRTMSPASPPT
jgi:phosphoribosylformylglycinamidine cyclo-ligase